MKKKKKNILSKLILLIIGIKRKQVFLGAEINLKKIIESPKLNILIKMIF